MIDGVPHWVPPDLICRLKDRSGKGNAIVQAAKIRTDMVGSERCPLTATRLRCWVKVPHARSSRASPG
jgi:hypothetical protein